MSYRRQANTTNAFLYCCFSTASRVRFHDKICLRVIVSLARTCVITRGNPLEKSKLILMTSKLFLLNQSHIRACAVYRLVVYIYTI